jgi:hypothetical protein
MDLRYNIGSKHILPAYFQTTNGSKGIQKDEKFKHNHSHLWVQFSRFEIMNINTNKT